MVEFNLTSYKLGRACIIPLHLLNFICISQRKIFFMLTYYKGLENDLTKLYYVVFFQNQHHTIIAYHNKIYIYIHNILWMVILMNFEYWPHNTIFFNCMIDCMYDIIYIILSGMYFIRSLIFHFAKNRNLWPWYNSINKQTVPHIHFHYSIYLPNFVKNYQQLNISIFE